MGTLFVYFTQDGNPDHATLRVNGKKVPDTDLWELWELYSVLTELGAHVVKMDSPDGLIIHIINY